MGDSSQLTPTLAAAVFGPDDPSRGRQLLISPVAPVFDPGISAVGASRVTPRASRELLRSPCRTEIGAVLFHHHAPLRLTCTLIHGPWCRICARHRIKSEGVCLSRAVTQVPIRVARVLEEGNR